MQQIKDVAEQLSWSIQDFVRVCDWIGLLALTTAIKGEKVTINDVVISD